MKRWTLELKALWGDVMALLTPCTCAVCGRVLVDGERCICTMCRLMAPRTGYCREAGNPVEQRFWGHIPVVAASSMLFYTPQGGWRHAIHALKYHHQWRIALELGTWYGALLAESGRYCEVDMVVPVPLHPFKRMRRGYNQAEYLAEAIARQLGVRVECRGLRRVVYTSPQALKPRRDRAENVKNAFRCTSAERFAGRHVLLVDDVLTTGSTLMACAEAILAVAPDCRISIATLAVARHGLGLE